VTEKALATMNEKGVVIKDTNDLWQVVNMICASGMCPKAYKGKPNDAMIAIIAGQAVGWKPIQALQYIAVVNGNPSMYGDGPAGLAYSAGNVEWMKEWWEKDGSKVDEPHYTKLTDYPDTFTACWQSKRKDCKEPSTVSRFSVADAKAAGLWGKTGTWSQYPKRMLVWRARGWGLRDNYADALQGITQAEEWEDMIPAKTLDPLEEETIDAEPEPTLEELLYAEKVRLCKETNERLIKAKSEWLKNKNDEGKNLTAGDFVLKVCEQVLGKPSIDTMEEVESIENALKNVELNTADLIPEPQENSDE
jgi:hypothetical protein